jgi:hypothetical protein
MVYEKAYWTSDKTRLHERLRKLSQDWATRGELRNVSLDAFIISATPYDALREYYGDGNWTREEFARKHILFFGGNRVDYLDPLFT